jgi:lipid-binding SYLF domain-containing protein
MFHKLTICVPFTALLFLVGCSTAPRTDQGRTEIEREAEVAQAKAERNDNSLARLRENSVGHAVFPSVGKAAVGVGGAYGKGVLFERGEVVGYCDVSQATIGLQLGAQSYTEILVFATRDAIDRFKSGNFAFDAQATAVAVRRGSAVNASFSEGVAVFTTDAAGLMLEAAVGGQKFSYQAL